MCVLPWLDQDRVGYVSYPTILHNCKIFINRVATKYAVLEQKIFVLTIAISLVIRANRFWCLNESV